MKPLIAFIVLFLQISCMRRVKPYEQVSTTDSAMVITDTVIAPVPVWDPVADSLAGIRERDSFFAVPLKRVFVSTTGNCWDQCAAFFLDTTQINRERLKVSYDVEPVTDWQMNVKKYRYWFSWDNYTLGITDPCPEDYCPQQFTINGLHLEPGVRLDTTVAGTWFLHHIVLYEDDFWRITAGNRRFIMANGFIRNCNGIGCGQLYNFLYDLDNNKAFVIDQFRGYQLYTGYNRSTGEVEFLKTDKDNWDRYNCLFETGKVIVLSLDGKLRFKTNAKGEQVGYKAWLPMSAEADSLCLYSLTR